MNPQVHGLKASRQFLEASVVSRRWSTTRSNSRLQWKSRIEFGVVASGVCFGAWAGLAYPERRCVLQLKMPTAQTS